MFCTGNESSPAQLIPHQPSSKDITRKRPKRKLDQGRALHCKESAAHGAGAGVRRAAGPRPPPRSKWEQANRRLAWRVRRSASIPSPDENSRCSRGRDAYSCSRSSGVEGALPKPWNSPGVFLPFKVARSKTGTKDEARGFTERAYSERRHENRRHRIGVFLSLHHGLRRIQADCQ